MFCVLFRMHRNAIAVQYFRYKVPFKFVFHLFVTAAVHLLAATVFISLFSKY